MVAIASVLPFKAQPWRERSGRVSWLKLVVFALLFVPGTLLAIRFIEGALGPKPMTEAIHVTGTWGVRFLLLSLCITPFRRVTQWNKLLLVRRMLGVGALFYLLAHFALYIASLHFDLIQVASEIVHRIYLTIGFVALVGLAALGLTSTDAAIRRLGAERWNRLHQVVYALVALGLLHFFMQSKLDVTEPTLMAGFFVLLMAHRLLAKLKWSDSIPALVLLAFASGLMTALLEAGWYGVASGVPPRRVLEANLSFDPAIRPAWWVLFAGLALVVIRVARPLWSKKPAQGAVRSRMKA